MWLLSCSGNVFQGHRHWLAPGTTNLLGRTSSKAEGGEHLNFIDHKSVSRKHLIITVAPVQAGDASKLHKRTEVTLTDNSKVGTTVDGEKFTKSDKKLDGKVHTIKLGSYEHTFKLEWVPVTLTCLWLKTKGKGGDALAEPKKKLEGTDIKVVAEYVSNETSHVLGKKRNAAQALQAVIQGKWLVTPEWVEQLAEATQRGVTGADGEWKPGLLEDDFDGNWPKEDDFIVPAGKEPNPRPNNFLKPNPERADIFQDFIFVFLTQPQYDNLLPVITTGGGKAMLFEVTPGETKVDDLVSYVRRLAGKKDDGTFQLTQDGGKGGIVIVRTGESDEEGREFQRKMDLALKQRSIFQNEFLDPILTLDTSTLRQPLPDGAEEDEDEVQPAENIRQPSAPRSPQRQNEQMEDVQEQPAVTTNGRRQSAAREVPAEEAAEEEPAAEEPAPQPTATKKKWNKRNLTKSRWQGFDDFDTSQFCTKVPASPSPEPQPSQAQSVQSMDVDGEPSQAGTQTRKRPPPIEEEQEEDIYESLMQGANAYKRRKTEAVKNGGKNAFAKASEEERTATERAAAKAKRKSEKLPDVQAKLKAQKEANDEQRRKDEEALREQLEGVDLSEVRNLIQVEEMELPVCEGAARPSRVVSREERWDPAWDGRKNFKKFRPQGQRRVEPRPQRVIVQLEEAPRRGHGIGDEYWLTREAASKGKAKSKPQSKSQSQSQTVRAGPSGSNHASNEGEEEDDSSRFRRRLQRSREEDAQDTTNQLDADEIAGGARAARDDGLRHLAQQSQTFGTESQRKAAGKRAAPAGAQEGGGPAKKVKQTQVPLQVPTQGRSRAQVRGVDEDEDEEDGLKFRRRTRR